VFALDGGKVHAGGIPRKSKVCQWRVTNNEQEGREEREESLFPTFPLFLFLF
jgi:hypothetical protein